MVCICREKGKAAQFKIASLNDRDDSGDSDYWLKYPAVLPQGKERLWDALLDSLEKYRYGKRLFERCLMSVPGCGDIDIPTAGY